jgi:hypothetical protein
MLSSVDMVRDDRFRVPDRPSHGYGVKGVYSGYDGLLQETAVSQSTDCYSSHPAQIRASPYAQLVCFVLRSLYCAEHDKKQRRKGMNHPVTFAIDADTVRFTPDGKVAVIDAIGALSEADCPKCIWNELKRSHPKIRKWYTDHSFPEEKNVPVASSRCWDRIQDLLLDHLIDQAS